MAAELTDVVVRTARLDGPAEVLDRLRSLLSCEERAEVDRFRRADERLQRAAARGLLRDTLARAGDVAPAAWRFQRDERGRPHVVAPAGGPDWRFSVTHTEGLVACVVSVGRAVGIDAENRSRAPGLLLDSHVALAAEERAVLSALDETARAAAFYRYWTLKEAYLKALGVGLQGGMRDAVFALGLPGSARLAADTRGEWSFVEIRPTPDHQLAVAVRISNTVDEQASSGRPTP